MPGERPLVHTGQPVPQDEAHDFGFYGREGPEENPHPAGTDAWRKWLQDRGWANYD
jgi:hypothetical protein